MPYDKGNGEWVDPEVWAQRKAERRVLNKAAFHAAKKVGKDLPRDPIGTKLGNRQRVDEFKNLLLTDLNGSRTINKVMEIAQDDEHPGQMAALKLCMDRMLPTSLFEEKKDGSRTAIQINISGIGDVSSDVIEGEISGDS